MGKIQAFFERSIGLFVVGALTLGLAPFVPEPHIWGKLKWVAGGANGMKAMDWFDLMFHGLPWILLLISLGFKMKSQFSK